MLMGCGVFGVSDSTERCAEGKRLDISSVLESMAKEGYLKPVDFHCIEEYQEAKKGYDGLGSKTRFYIGVYIEARDDFEKIKATILSADYPDKDKITDYMRQKIIDNEYIFLKKDSPECIRLYRDALVKFELADNKLKKHYRFPLSEFITNEIAIYERFLKAK